MPIKRPHCRTLLLCMTMTFAAGTLAAGPGNGTLDDLDESVSGGHVVEVNSPRLTKLYSTLSVEEQATVGRLDTILQEVLAASVEKAGAELDMKSFELESQTPYTKYSQIQDNAPIVDITITGDADPAISTLKSTPGVTVNGVASTPGYTLVSAAIQPAKLLDAASLPGVRQLIASGMMTDGENTFPKAQGSVTNQAEEELGVNALRRVFSNVDGSGLEIGALSDSINVFDTVIGDGLFGIAESQNTGDLPANNLINVIQDGSAGDDDEGRAMMELIYDIAPDCSMYNFATANGGEAAYAGNITNLGNAGCDVVVDDVVYFAEPQFQDGVLAVSAENYVANGGVYFASAGNRGMRSRIFEYSNADNDSFMDFSPGDETVSITIAGPGGGANNSTNLIVQWTEPWGNATVDMEVVIYNSTNSSVLMQTTTNNVGGNPYERMIYTNTTGAAQNVNVVIRVDSGDPTGMTVKMINFDASVTFNEYADDFGGAINPHAAATNVFGMAASPFFDRDNAETFSSRGPHRIYFFSNGTPIPIVNFITRGKPDFLSVDGTETTFFGIQINDGNNIPNFFGTSASAPNAAAVALLLIDAAGTSGSLTENDIDDILRASSIDIGNDGFDPTNGYGRIHALGAGVLAAGRYTDEFVLYPNQFGDAKLSSNLINESDTDNFLYGQTEPDAAVEFNLNESTNFDMDPMLTLINAETEAPVDVIYDADGSDDGILDNAIGTIEVTNTDVYYGRILSETSFSGGSSEYTLAVDGPSPFVVSSSFGNGTIIELAGLLTESPVDVDHTRFTMPDDISEEGRLSVDFRNLDFIDGVLILWDSDGDELDRLGEGNGIGARDIVNFTGLSAGEEYVLGFAPHEYEWSGGTSDNYNLSAFTTRYPNQPVKLTAIPLSYDDIVRPNPVSGRDLKEQIIYNLEEVRTNLFVPFGDDVDFFAYVPSGKPNQGEISAGLYTSAGERLAGTEYDTDTSFLDIDAPSQRRLHRIYAGIDDSVPPSEKGIAVITDYYETPAPRTKLTSMNFSTPNQPYLAEATEANELSLGENGYHMFTFPNDAHDGEGGILVEVTGGGDLDTLIRLFDSAGNLLEAANFEGSGGIEKISSDPGSPIFTPGEVYYVHVQGDKDEDVTTLDTTQSGEYKITVQAVLPDLQPTPTPTPTPGAFEGWVIK